MATAHPFIALLLIAVSGAALLGLIRVTGVAIGQFGQVIRRADNPEAFDFGLLLAGFILLAVLLIAGFGQWARSDSEKLTKSYLESLQDGAAQTRRP